MIALDADVMPASTPMLRAAKRSSTVTPEWVTSAAARISRDALSSSVSHHAGTKRDTGIEIHPIGFSIARGSLARQTSEATW